MPRRIIYIQNPKEGSNFRTIGGGTATPTKTPKKKSKSKTLKDYGWSTLPDGWRVVNGQVYDNHGIPIKTPTQWSPNRPAGKLWNWKTRKYDSTTLPNPRDLWSGTPFSELIKGIDYAKPVQFHSGEYPVFHEPQLADVPQWAIFFVGGVAIIAGVSLAPASLGTSSGVAAIGYGLIAGGATLPIISATGIPMTYRTDSQDLVGWIQDNVSIQERTKESAVSGKTTVKSIVIQGLND